MKVVIILALWCLCDSLVAQVGAKADEIVIPKSFGSRLVLHHCEALEVKSEGVKVKHDDGTYLVPIGNLPEAWKKWVTDKKAAAEAAQEPGPQRAPNEAKKTADQNETVNWKAMRQEDGSEILRVRLVSVWDNAMVVELMQSTPPVVGTTASPGADGKEAPGSYNGSGTLLVLTGTLPVDPVDNQMYTVKGKKGKTRKFQDKTLQSYQVSHFKKGISP